MTLQTLITIILVSIGIIILVSLFILTFILARKTVKNNPKNAIVLTRRGDEIIVEKGKQIEKSGKSSKYKYGNKFVLVPSKYDEYYLKNKKVIFINSTGQLIASPFNINQALSNVERDNLIYEFIESHVGSDGMKAIKGTQKTVNIIVIAVIAFLIGVAGMFIFNQYQNTMKNQPADIESPTQEPNITQPIEVK